MNEYKTGDKVDYFYYDINNKLIKEERQIRFVKMDFGTARYNNGKISVEIDLVQV
jgi:hypothetical protein